MRSRVSTTVDEALLEKARGLLDWPNDATMMDAALDALARLHRNAEIDTAYEAYDLLPLDTPDAWGSLESFHAANQKHRGQTDTA